MIGKLRIQNFKSIVDLTVELGRTNVFIGENGSGKSNILEAIAFAAVPTDSMREASRDPVADDRTMWLWDVDEATLKNRGARVTDPEFMRSAFPSESPDATILVSASDRDGVEISYQFHQSKRTAYSNWIAGHRVLGGNEFSSLSPQQQRDHLYAALMAAEQSLRVALSTVATKQQEVDRSSTTALHLQNGLRQSISLLAGTRDRSFGPLSSARELLRHFAIYSPENTLLRTFEREGQLLPLGTRGEGLFRLLTVLASPNNADRWDELKANLKMLDRFDDVEIGNNLAPYEYRLQIKDRYLDPKFRAFDQRSSNEGFLFLLFYFSLFVSSDTPPFFAIDNIDASLNPKTCRELVRRLAALSAKYNKQSILTTHNPSVLDGLNLHDDEQRLFVVSRNRQGHTRVKRVMPPTPVAGEKEVRLSEAFVSGLLGGLPKNF